MISNDECIRVVSSSQEGRFHIQKISFGDDEEDLIVSYELSNW